MSCFVSWPPTRALLRGGRRALYRGQAGGATPLVRPEGAAALRSPGLRRGDNEGEAGVGAAGARLFAALAALARRSRQLTCPGRASSRAASCACECRPGGSARTPWVGCPPSGAPGSGRVARRGGGWGALCAPAVSRVPRGSTWSPERAGGKRESQTVLRRLGVAGRKQPGKEPGRC